MKPLRTIAAVLALVSALATAQGEEAAKQKIVSLGGSVTEVIVELGALNQLVAIDQSSIYPKEKLAKLPQVGYYRQIGAEGVLSLAPTLVLTTSEAGPKEALDQIKAAGVPVHVLPEKKTLAGAREKIEEIAKILGRTTEAQPVLAKFDASLAEARGIVAGTASGKKPKVLFVMNSNGAGAFTVAGSATGVDEMIREAGGENVASSLHSYQSMSVEAITATAPDVVLVASGGGPSALTVETVSSSPALAGSPAVKNGRVSSADLTLMAGFGPRCAEELKTLALLLHGQPQK